mmetsp:Transcript_2463/g.7279  ORF Transcript_2463/g.7279 Transcript_2463/m.7279 type:complete len:402 (-) Transcript_2463:7-1212(-)
MRSPLCFVVCVLALAPSCGFVRRTRVGRAVATRATGETYNGMYDRRGRPRRGKPDPEQTYYAYDGSVVESPAKFSRTVRRRGYAPPWLFHYTSKASAQDIMDASRLRASTDDGSNTDVKFGEGIYFTSLPPWAEPDQIIDNNYRGSYRRRDCAESYVAISIKDFPVDREIKHVNSASRDIWLLCGRDDLNLFRAQASLFLDKDGTDPDAFWEIDASVGYRRMKDQNYRMPHFGEPRYDRSALEMFDRGASFELTSDASSENERPRSPDHPARRAIHTEWCGPSVPNGVLFQTIDSRTGRPVEPSGSPIEHAEALSTMFGLDEQQQPGTPTIPDLAGRRPRSPLERLVALRFPEAPARDALREAGGDLDAAFAALSRTRSDAQAAEGGNRAQRRRRRRRRLP